MVEIEGLREDGWNIFIECKSKGRTFEMTYEATMYNINDGVDGNTCLPCHAVGSSLDELAENLRKSAEN